MRHPGRIWPAFLVIAILVTGCSSSAGPSASAPASSAIASASASAPAPSTSPTASQPEASCDPACDLMRIQPPNLTRPGKLPAGVYTTQYFYPGGLSITIDDGWSSHEDSTGEFALDRDGPEGDAMEFWLDVTPVTWDGKPVDGVVYTPEGVSTWLHGLTWLTVGPAKPTTIGQDHLPALVMDIDIPTGAPNVDPGCPTPSCVEVFDFPEWEGAWAMSSDQHVRLYLSQIGDGPHTLAVLFNVYDAATFAPTAQPVLDSMKLSAELK